MSAGNCAGVQQRAVTADRHADEPNLVVTACLRRLYDFGPQPLDERAVEIVADLRVGDEHVEGLARCVDEAGDEKLLRLVADAGQHDDERVAAVADFERVQRRVVLRRCRAAAHEQEGERQRTGAATKRHWTTPR